MAVTGAMAPPLRCAQASNKACAAMPGRNTSSSAMPRAPSSSRKVRLAPMRRSSASKPAMASGRDCHGSAEGRGGSAGALAIGARRRVHSAQAPYTANGASTTIATSARMSNPMRQPKKAKAQFPAVPMMISPRRSPRRIVDDSSGKVMPAGMPFTVIWSCKQIKRGAD
jgi:hypothetical protein